MIVLFSNKEGPWPGTLTDITSIVFSDPTGAYGVRRTDTNAIVVAANVAFNHDGTGLYSYTVTEPTPGLTYEIYKKITRQSSVYYEQTYSVGTPSIPSTMVSNQIARLIPAMNAIPFMQNGSDTDAFVTTVIQGVEAAAIRWCKRNFLLHTNIDEFLDGDGSRLLIPNEYPIISLASIAVWGQNNQTWNIFTTDLVIDNAKGLIEFSGRNLTSQYGNFPRGKQNIEIVYTAGYTAVPSDVIQGITVWVAEECNRLTRDTSLTMEMLSHYKWQDKESNQDDPADPPKTARRYLASYRKLFGAYNWDRK